MAVLSRHIQYAKSECFHANDNVLGLGDERQSADALQLDGRTTCVEMLNVLYII